MQEKERRKIRIQVIMYAEERSVGLSRKGVVRLMTSRTDCRELFFGCRAMGKKVNADLVFG